MSSKQPSFLLWDCSLCPSKDVNFIGKLAQNFNLNPANLSIVVSSASSKDAKENLSSIPPSVNDLSIAYHVDTRFGNNALYDSIVDAVNFLKKNSKNCTFILITTNFPIWINIFQRMPPKNLVFASIRDPRSSLDFSFMPSSISLTVLKWPSLENLTSIKGTQPIEIEEFEYPSMQQQQKKGNNKKELQDTSESDGKGINAIDLILDNEAQSLSHASNISSNMQEIINDNENDDDDDDGTIEAIKDIDYHEEANALDNALNNESENEIASNSLIEEEESSQISSSSQNAKRKQRFASTTQSFGSEKHKTEKGSVASTPPRNSIYDSMNNDSDHSSISTSGNGKRSTGIPQKNTLAANKPTLNSGNRISSSNKNASTITAPVKFQPLIEAMKSIGKAMIALSDLEDQLKKWSESLNQPIENTNAYISKASDAGIVIYDKSINYVRFKNRVMMSANVEYV